MCAIGTRGQTGSTRRPDGGQTGVGAISATFPGIDRHVPADTVFTNGAGNFAGWLSRFHRFAGMAVVIGPSRLYGRWLRW